MSSERLLSSIILFAGSGFCSEKGLEVDASYRRLFGWDVLCGCSTVAIAVLMIRD